ncbi:MAG: type II secretion system F family protein [Euzebya sp.]
MSGLLTLLAIASTGVFVVSLAVQLWPPRRRLAGRVRPYAAASLSRLGRPVPAVPVGTPTSSAARAGWADLVITLMPGGTIDTVLQTRLVQSGRYSVAADRIVAEHRARQLFAGLLWGAAALGLGAAVGLAPLGVVALSALGAAAGALRPTAALDRAIQDRRAALRAEIPAVCQLLALRLRANGSVVAALSQTVSRTTGVLVQELSEALAQHRAGRPLDQALDAAAITTPEPESARVHRLLAAAIRHGLDTAPELLRLAGEARQSQLQRLRRDSTRRRATILLPTIGLLAPLMMLFIAAPLPGLVLGL